MRYLYYLVIAIFTVVSLSADVYNFSNEPLDVVIPCAGKDLETLEMCIAGVKENCPYIRNVYILSSEKYTDNAIWFDEAKFPFTKEDVALYIFNGDAQKASEYLLLPNNRIGWYFQQILKFYAPFVIPDISANVLILDADTIILHPIQFVNEKNGGRYTFTYKKYEPYFDHAKRFLGEIILIYPRYSAIAHHMVFQRPVLEELFSVVETKHQEELWKAFCHCVDHRFLITGASEYEIYFSFVFSKTKEVDIHYLAWKEIKELKKVDTFRKKGYHYVTCHSHRRK